MIIVDSITREVGIKYRGRRGYFGVGYVFYMVRSFLESMYMSWVIKMSRSLVGVYF